MTTPIVLDTDIGTDIDDTIALAVLLGSRASRLVGLTTVYVDARLRAQLARNLLDRAGVEIDVWTGESVPIRPIPALAESGVWEWHEGRGVLYEDISPEEREYRSGLRPRTRTYVRTDSEVPERLGALAKQHGALTLVCIGPLTNLATTLRRSPTFADSVAAVTIMGGCFRAGVDEPQVEHNFAADPGAVEVVFRSALPLTIVSFDATQACYLLRDRALALCDSNTPLSTALTRLIDIYFDVKSRWRTSMHDPVAIAVTEDPTIGDVRSTDVFFDPATGGTSLEPFPGSISRTVSLLRTVSTQRCESYIYDGLRRACERGGR